MFLQVLVGGEAVIDRRVSANIITDAMIGLAILRTANLRAVGITEDIHFEEMADKTLGAGKKAFYPLEKEDIIAILKKSL